MRTHTHTRNRDHPLAAAEQPTASASASADKTAHDIQHSSVQSCVTGCREYAGFSNQTPHRLISVITSPSTGEGRAN